MIEINPLLILYIFLGLGVISFLLLSLGFVLGYSCYLTYNKSAKLAMNNLGVLNNHLSEQLKFEQSQNGVSQRSYSQISPQSEVRLNRRDDVSEALIEEGNFNIESLIQELPLEEQAQLYAQEEIR
tara:strand:- start:2250 stop:2627 length:378 start_codon:yes stop_codon:yes gene_type:complete